MSTATSSVGAVFLMMAASMTGFVKWTYSTSPGIEPPIPEIVPEATVQEHEKVEAWEWRLVADALSNHFLNPHLLADIPMAAWAVIALLACIDMVVLAWMLRQFCCRRRGNDVKVTELADAVAANVCGNGPLPLLLSPSHQKKPLTDDWNNEAEEDTEKVVEDSVATNVSASCPSPVLLSPSRPTADSRGKAVCVTSQTTDVTGESRGFPSCAPPGDTLTGDVPCDTLMGDVPCATGDSRIRSQWDNKKLSLSNGEHWHSPLVLNGETETQATVFYFHGISDRTEFHPELQEFARQNANWKIIAPKARMVPQPLLSDLPPWLFSVASNVIFKYCDNGVEMPERTMPQSSEKSDNNPRTQIRDRCIAAWTSFLPSLDMLEEQSGQLNPTTKAAFENVKKLLCKSSTVVADGRSSTILRISKAKTVGNCLCLHGAARSLLDALFQEESILHDGGRTELDFKSEMELSLEMVKGLLSREFEKDPNRKIIFWGHSLGGYFAAHAALNGLFPMGNMANLKGLILNNSFYPAWERPEFPPSFVDANFPILHFQTGGTSDFLISKLTANATKANMRNAGWTGTDSDYEMSILPELCGHDARPEKAEQLGSEWLAPFNQAGVQARRKQ